jgi:CheY-specific phosphatase CheX
MTTNEEVIDQAVTSSCTSLFADYSLPLERVDLQTLQDKFAIVFCGIVGFTGDQMRGALLLATSAEPLGRTLPSSDASLREWIAELSNQLLGRIKNKLVSHGVTLHMSTPTVLRGQHIAPVSSTPIVPYAFSSGAGVVCVWIDVEIIPGVDLTQVTDAPDVMSEGSGFLF